MSSPDSFAGLPPGPPLSPAETTFRWLAQPYAFLDECAARYGDRFRLQFTRFGTHVIVSHPDDVRAVFAGERDSLLAGRGNSLLEPVLGSHSLLLVDGERHLEQRAMLQPAFTLDRVNASVATVAAAVRRWSDPWVEGTTIGLQRHALEISKEVILKLVLGLEDDELPRYSNLIHRMMSLVGTNATFGNEEDEGPLQRRFHAIRDEMGSALQEQIERRRATAADGTAMLALLLRQRDTMGKPLGDDALRDQLLTMILAGHETTASTITWALLCLHENPAALTALSQELEAQDTADNPTGLLRLPRLQATCLETLRVRPVIPVISRLLARPLPLRDCTLPAGVFVTPSPYLAHHREESFPDPTRFEPSRFLDRRYPPHVFFPFGGGARRCIGMSFALMEVQVVVGMLLQRFRFRGCGPVRPVRRAVTIVASGGGKMQIERRLVH